jgi:hypothetical protein
MLAALRSPLSALIDGCFWRAFIHLPPIITCLQIILPYIGSVVQLHFEKRKDLKILNSRLLWHS